MKFVMYLSGRSETKAWHQAHDSVAASYAVPVALREKTTNALIDCGVFEEGRPDLLRWGTIGEEIDDWCSDTIDEGPTHPLFEVAQGIRSVVMCEASCGVIHVVSGNP